jgi:hypothetical protein
MTIRIIPALPLYAYLCRLNLNEDNKLTSGGLRVAWSPLCANIH